MAIPKVIYQTFKTKKIPLLVRFYQWLFMKKNPGWHREFYDDERILTFVRENFDNRTANAYEQLQIGAAKADFFRYAVLYVYGGVYLDLDSDILVTLDRFLLNQDQAVVAREKNHPDLFAQWALIYDKKHPFLEKTLQYIVENIENNRYPNDVHKMTGPTAYTRAISDVLSEQASVHYRLVNDDYKGMMQFKYRLGKLLIYKNRKNHWKKMQEFTTVLKGR